MDRKAWIVVIICSILLAYNIHVSSQNAAAKAAEARKLAEAQAAADPEPSPENPTGVSPTLEVQRPELGPSEKSADFELETATNVFTLSSLEGGIKDALFKEELAVDDLSKKVRMNDLGPNRIGGLVDRSGKALDLPFYKVQSQSTDSITFIGRLSNGLGVKKIWQKATEGNGSDYRLSLTLELVNLNDTSVSLGNLYLSTGSAAPLTTNEQARYRNFFWQTGDDFESEMQGFFEGGFFSKEKLDFVEESEAGIEFAGVANQFFATIVDPEDLYRATVRARPKTVDLPNYRGGTSAKILYSSLSLPDETLDAKAKKTLKFDIYVGPKNNSLIRSLDGEKDGVMDYGFFLFAWIARGLNWTLNMLAGLFGGPWAWGWAVVVLTIIIRTFMWPLHAKSTRTMKRMSKLQPKMAELKEKYPDDPNKMNQEMMKLYREFGVNPMGGCLPMLLQIPIFFGFFTMLQYAVELRNQPFLGWVKDLSQPDTVGHLPFSFPFLGDAINILPILMAVTMVLQMKMTPQTGDKMQRRIFMFMPIIFFFFCYNFASALALYWTTQNIFSIGQTWLMQKMPEPELKSSGKANKPSMMQKLAARAEEAQKMKKAQQKGGQKTQNPKKPRGPKTGG